ncbi:hypothetical protein PR048_009999 [Dryococelus australis]|uniref:Uncharacterized protein n=1 Tax=Dryococelus australis TaxID=614101 RepID=A0ABQ9I1H5_9NEOP|nr:hypothetical protein PR048_009999 [Dryococelus australis]
MQAALSGTIPTCENPGVTRPGIEAGSPWRKPTLADIPVNSLNPKTAWNYGTKLLPTHIKPQLNFLWCGTGRTKDLLAPEVQPTLWGFTNLALPSFWNEVLAAWLLRFWEAREQLTVARLACVTALHHPAEEADTRRNSGISEISG